MVGRLARELQLQVGPDFADGRALLAVHQHITQARRGGNHHCVLLFINAGKCDYMLAFVAHGIEREIKSAAK